jgi:hypothetical protein
VINRVIFTILILGTSLLQADPLEGDWRTVYGRLKITAVKAGFEGTYRDGTISSTGEKNGWWHFTYREAGHVGLARFKADGTRLIGEWRPNANAVWQDWSGTKADTAPTRPADTLAGAWSTNFGMVKLMKTGAGFEGFYGAGTLKSVKQENGWWLFDYQEGPTDGKARFKLDRGNLVGQWRTSENKDWKDWKGTRPLPSKNRYLIVLEAPWEADFKEEPTAFADMLESHFNMAENLSIRKMQVHDPDDIELYCRRVALMTDPVYLLVSSHGTAKGLTMNGHTIPAKSFDYLKYCDNLKLLHLSGCSMMKGNHDKEIRRIAGDHFPISGYKIDVPWNASALSDYVYLSQIFIDGVSPQKAVERTHKLIPYSHKTDALPGYPAMGLSIR